MTNSQTSRPANDVALGILDGLAVLARQHLSQFVHVLIQELNEFHEHAGAALRVGGSPFRLGSLGVLNGCVHFRVAGQRHGCLNFAGCRIEDIAGAAAGACNTGAANEMTRSRTW